MSRGGAISGAGRGAARDAVEKRLPTGEERARLVREMFDRIADRYELLNTLMSAGLNRIWNRKVLNAAGLRAGWRALDLACGTGTLTRDLAK
ncbi:MAG: class I SAM-dependent methyltransferase, partial [Actinomycetota bacterium]|nr:class I SAM-dependent methyltransferase [Actinomycetota bacterium]